MNYRILSGLLCLLVFSCLPAFAQTKAVKTVPNIFQGGVLNGKAISLPKPDISMVGHYGAGGVVNVQVTIDETGNVISATAVSGHPLLRGPSVEAAKQAKFKSILAIKVTGVLVYNFGNSDNDGLSPASGGNDQTESSRTTPKVISKGVLNGVALSLPKPAYPPTAIAVGAGGAVNVEVTIDEEGNVSSAAAVSGHPLLRAVSVEAARQAKFKPTLLSGQPVKVSGVIVYNFVPPAPVLTWRSAGFEIAFAERSPALPLNFPANSINVLLPNSWNSERMEVLKLSALQNSMNSSGAARGELVTAAGKIDIASLDHKQVLGSLIASLENRLYPAQNDLWNFKLGLLLGRMSTQIDDDDALRVSLRELQMLEATAPGDLGKELSQFGEFMNKNEFELRDRTQLRMLIARLKN